MFIGHIGLALAAKHVAPKPSLGTLTLAAQWADGLWPIFLLLGWEIYLVSVFGPPPNVDVLALSGLLGWLFLAWAYWIDRHRESAD